MRIAILLAFMLVYLSISAQTRGATPCATGAQSETAHWRVYIDRDHISVFGIQTHTYRFLTLELAVAARSWNTRGAGQT
jgi:hypothetical protein